MKNIILMDIDGTLANATHRLHHIRGDKDSGKRNWGAFFREAKNDEPYEHIVQLNHMYISDGFYVYLVTGRPENLRKDTEEWLQEHNIQYNGLLMRPVTDRRPDYESKKELFEKHPFLSDNKDKVMCVFEDRLQVAKMWRDLGLHVCLCGDDWLEGNWSK